MMHAITYNTTTDAKKIGIPLVGQTMFINGVKHFWTGHQWVTEEYLRKVMNPGPAHFHYDKHNDRAAAIKATKDQK